MIEVDALVIQGPTTYCKEVSEYYKDYKQIWSTWNSEPQENLDYLRSLPNVSLVTDDLPVLSSKEKSGSGHGPWCLERELFINGHLLLTDSNLQIKKDITFVQRYDQTF